MNVRSLENRPAMDSPESISYQREQGPTILLEQLERAILIGVGKGLTHFEISQRLGFEKGTIGNKASQASHQLLEDNSPDALIRALLTKEIEMDDVVSESDNRVLRARNLSSLEREVADVAIETTTNFEQIGFQFRSTRQVAKYRFNTLKEKMEAKTPIEAIVIYMAAKERGVLAE